MLGHDQKMAREWRRAHGAHTLTGRGSGPHATGSLLPAFANAFSVARDVVSPTLDLENSSLASSEKPSGTFPGGISPVHVRGPPRVLASKQHHLVHSVSEQIVLPHRALGWVSTSVTHTLCTRVSPQVSGAPLGRRLVLAPLWVPRAW